MRWRYAPAGPGGRPHTCTTGLATYSYTSACVQSGPNTRSNENVCLISLVLMRTAFFSCGGHARPG